MVNLNKIKVAKCIEGTSYRMLDCLVQYHIISEEEGDVLEDAGLSDEEFEKVFHEALKKSSEYEGYKLFEIEGDRIARTQGWKTYRLELYEKGI